MYHLRDVTLSLTMRNSMIYEAQVATPRMPRHKTPSLSREGWGGSPVGVGLQFGSLVGVSFNPSPQPPVIKQVTPYGEVFLFVATPL